MSIKRKGKFTLLESIDLLEATTSRGYPDNGTGIAGDDDYPPGNIVYGEKYKKVPYFNRLTDFQERWGVDTSDWKWDEFEKSVGMDDRKNYSDTLQTMKDLFPPEVWKRVWAKMKNVPASVTTKRFKDAKQPWRKGGGQDQMSSLDDEPHVDIDVDKGGSFKDAKVKDDDKNESITVKRISNIIL
jgi:hypothetical protein